MDICTGNTFSRTWARKKHMKWLGWEWKTDDRTPGLLKHPSKRLQEMGRKRIKILNCLSHLGFYLLLKFMQKESKIIEASSTSFKLFAAKKTKLLQTAPCVPATTKTKSRCNRDYKHRSRPTSENCISREKHLQTMLLKLKLLKTVTDFFHYSACSYIYPPSLWILPSFWQT